MSNQTTRLIAELQEYGYPEPAVSPLAREERDDGKHPAPSAGITVPRPHVPFGPQGVPEMLADADYLDEAARRIRDGYAAGGYNVTTTVVNLLHNAATALRAQHRTSTDSTNGAPS